MVVLRYEPRPCVALILAAALATGCPALAQERSSSALERLNAELLEPRSAPEARIIALAVACHYRSPDWGDEARGAILERQEQQMWSHPDLGAALERYRMKVAEEERRARVAIEVRRLEACTEIGPLGASLSSLDEAVGRRVGLPAR